MADPISVEEAVRIAKGLTKAQRILLLAMSGEHRASDFGWVSSNSTVQMRAMNRHFPLIARRYRAGGNKYNLTPLGLAVRAYLLAQTPSGDGHG